MHNVIAKRRTGLGDQKRSGYTLIRSPHVVMRSPISPCRKVREILYPKRNDIIAVSRRLSEELKLPSHKPSQKPQLMPATKQKKLKRHR